MKIVDKKTGKRLNNEGKAINKILKKTDPLQRNVNKKLEVSEHSPMDPPEAYDAESNLVDGVDYNNLSNSLNLLIHEHDELEQETEKFEKAMGEFHDSNFIFTQDINDKFNAFFEYFDNHILPHNRKEERHLFPILHKKLIESGEHSPSDNSTAVDIMEDDHIKFIQLAALSFNLLGLASRLPDIRSRAMTFDLAYHNSKELVELLRLHVFRENNTIFPLAQKLLLKNELEQVDLAIH